LNADCTEASKSASLDAVAVSPEKPPEIESRQSKRSHGGKRRGAGRKPNLAKCLLAGVRAKTAADILATIDTQALVNDLLKNASRLLKWQVLMPCGSASTASLSRM
jgi:hypothetical protein